MTPDDFARWATVLRLDPFVLLVLAWSVHVLQRQHAEAMTLLRELRDMARNAEDDDDDERRRPRRVR